MALPFFLENGKKEEVNITIKWIYLPEITHFFFLKKERHCETVFASRDVLIWTL